MEWSDIRIFLQVVREGSMVAATAPLRMNHSTISRRIARLEQESGVHLFDRAGRRLALTAEGKKVLAAAQKLESIILREIDSLADEEKHIAGAVRIGMTEEFGAHYLAPRLSVLAAALPDLEIELVALPRAFSLAAREVDVVVTLDRPTSGDVRFRKLTELEYGIYCSTQYLESRALPLPQTLAELSNETWCGYIQDLLFTAELADLPGGADDLYVKYRTTSITAQLGAVLAGCALAALPCFVAATQPRLKRLLPDRPVSERSYWLAVHEDLAKSPRVRALMDALEAMVAREKNIFRPSAIAGPKTSPPPLPPERLPLRATKINPPPLGIRIHSRGMRSMPLARVGGPSPEVGMRDD
jgi:DNA-binding transcriptional LysR family regulator